MSGYTPGPWDADCERVYFGRVGGISLHDAPNPEANARLIAAAPELLEAAQAVDKWIDDMFPYSEPGTVPAACFGAIKAAIAKATEAAS